MEFKTQVCTTREQSKQLLELGLKPETADMRIVLEENFFGRRWVLKIGFDKIRYKKSPECYIPAWSLHRLMVIGDDTYECFRDMEQAYEQTISAIINKIKNGDLNKKYLKKQNPYWIKEI